MYYLSHRAPYLLVDKSSTREVVLNNAPFNTFISGFRTFRDSATLKNNTETYASQQEVQFKTSLKVPIRCTMAKEPKQIYKSCMHATEYKMFFSSQTNMRTCEPFHHLQPHELCQKGTAHLETSEVLHITG
jgi:hypothetical protein